MIKKPEDTSILEGRVVPDDKEPCDLTVSYTRLEVFENCPFKYDLKYNQKKNGLNQDTIALKMGSIAHKVLELKGDTLIDGKSVDYDALRKVLAKGYIGSNVSDDDEVIGVEKIREKFGFEEFYKTEGDEYNYEQKLKIFSERVLPNEMEDDDWKVIGTEHEFSFIYLLPYKDVVKRIKFVGFVDRIDQKGDDLRVVDYKTSRKTYSKDKTTTSMQMMVYALAIYLECGKVPSDYLYSFVFLNERQEANTPGYLKRGIKKIDKLLTDIFTNEDESTWSNKPSPLCYWCDYNEQGIIYDPIIGGLCQKYCEWTPSSKTFAVHDGDSYDTPKKPQRKLIF